MPAALPTTQNSPVPYLSLSSLGAGRLAASSTAPIAPVPQHSDQILLAIQVLAEVLCGPKEIGVEKVEHILSFMFSKADSDFLKNCIYSAAFNREEVVERYIQKSDESTIKQLIARSMVLFAYQKVSLAIELMDLFLDDRQLLETALRSLGEGLDIKNYPFLGSLNDLNDLRAEIAAKLLDMRRFSEATTVIGEIPLSHSRCMQLRGCIHQDSFLGTIRLHRFKKTS